MSNALQFSVERYAAQPTPAHRQSVAVAALPLVRSMVRRIHLPDHPLATYPDLENAGMLGVLQALDNYEPQRGTSFASFAYGRIRGALVDFLRSIDTLSRERRRRVAEVMRVTRELEQRNGGPLPAEEIATEIGIPVSEYHLLCADAQHRYTVSLSESDDPEQGPSVLDQLAHPNSQDDQDQLETRSLYDHVCTLIRHLPERERHIVALYYFENLTLRQIAAQMNLTEARISQILSKTLQTLRAHLQQTRNAA